MKKESKKKEEKRMKENSISRGVNILGVVLLRGQAGCPVKPGTPASKQIKEKEKFCGWELKLV